MVALSNYPTSQHCCCCTIHHVLQSTTDKHCKLKKELQMRISHYNNSVPSERSSQKTQLNLSAGQTMFGSVCQREDPIQTANALGIVRPLLDDAALNRDNFQQLRPLAGWMCACVHVLCVCLHVHTCVSVFMYMCI